MKTKAPGWCCRSGMGLALLLGLGLPATATDHVVAEADPEGVTSAADGTWLAMAPPPRYAHTAVYDSRRHRMLFFGGADPRPRNDVWALDLGERPRWRLLTPRGAPPRRGGGASSIYDPVGDRMLVFGGADIWELALGPMVWRQLVPFGTGPAARGWQTAIYDPVRRRMLVFTGSEVWELRLSGVVTKWTQLAPEGAPPARVGHTAIYDPLRDRMLIFGGYDGVAGLNDVWELKLLGKLAWNPLPTTNAPKGRHSHTAVHDPVGDRMVVFGGFLPRGHIAVGDFAGDEWELALGVEPATWNPVVPSGETPGARTSHVAIYDPVGRQMVVHGGTRENPGGINLGLDDVWARPLAGSPRWSRLVEDRSPGFRQFQASTYDPVRDRILVFGGYRHAGINATVPMNDTYAFAPEESPSWTRLSPAGTPPRWWASGWSATAIHDPVRDRLILLSGAELWELRFSPVLEWRALTPVGTSPPARSAHTAIYDPVGDRMIVFGGMTALWGPSRNDLWALTLSEPPTWTELVPAGTLVPPVRNSHTAIYDPVRHRMVVFAGAGSSLLNDVWELSLSGPPGWNPLAPTGTAPVRRRGATAVYDPLRDRMVIFSGEWGYEKDAWALSLSGVPAWRQLVAAGQPPNGRVWHTAVYDPARDRMVVLGGSRMNHVGSFHYENAPYALAWGSALGTAGTEDLQSPQLASSRSDPAHTGGQPPQGLSLAPSRPNPARSGLEIRFSLARAGPVELRVYDLAGRSVKTLLSAALPAGAHVARWDLRDEDGALVPAGIYAYALRAGGTWLVRRAVVIP